MRGNKSLLVCVFVSAFVAYKRCHQAAGVNVCGSIQELPCDGSQCIPRDRWCDGIIDCVDGTDEKYCLKTSWWNPTIPDNGCNEKHFTCRNMICIPAVGRCDNFDDCGDYSDEDGCKETLKPEEDGLSGIEESFLRSTTTTTMRPTTTTKRSTTSAAPLPRITPTIPPTTQFYGNRESQESIDLDQHSHTNNYDQSRNGRQRPTNYYDQTPESFTDQSHLHQSNRDYFTPLPTNRPRYDPAGPSRHSYVSRQHPMILPPRMVVNHPNSRQLYHSRKKTGKVNHPLFYFANNYTKTFAYNYERNVELAKRWLVDQRDDSSYNWGQDTPRALEALSLITNSFTSDVAENDLMKKGLQAHLGVKLLRNRTEPLTVPSLAMYINALQATCQDPKDFMGLDLVDILSKRRHVRNPNQPIVNPFVYLTLCLSNSPLCRQDIQQLESLLVQRFSDEATKDQHILAITALSCVLKQYDASDYEKHELSVKVMGAIDTLLSQRQSDGSFGSIYSTAIAAQALMSINLISWDPRQSLDYLAQHQSRDGSFGDMLSTYYTLPALSGRSLVHLRNTQCDPTTSSNEPLTPVDILNLPGPWKSVFYSIRVGYPEEFSFAMQLTVAEHINLFDFMRVAAFLDPRFRFQYKTSNNEIDVYDISNIPNDPERGLHWNLYVLEDSESKVNLESRYEGDIQRLIPRHSQEILYWYLPTV